MNVSARMFPVPERVPLPDGSMLAAWTSSGHQELFEIVNFEASGSQCLCYEVRRQSDGQSGFLKEFFPKDQLDLSRTDDGSLVFSGLDFNAWKHSKDIFTSSYLQLNAASSVKTSTLANYLPAFTLYISSQEDNGTILVFSAMEKGITFYDWLDNLNEMELNLDEAIYKLFKILETLCDALGEIHQAGFSFQDIQPKNFLIRLTRQNEINPTSISIFDLDSFCRFDQPAKERIYCATPGFASPEMDQKIKNPQSSLYISHQSDLYAVGCLLYYALLSQNKMDGNPLLFSVGDYETIPYVWTESQWIARTRQVYQDSYLQVQAEEILHKSLAFKPKNRYPDARRMAHDLNTAARLASLDMWNAFSRFEHVKLQARADLPIQKQIIMQALNKVPVTDMPLHVSICGYRSGSQCFLDSLASRPQPVHADLTCSKATQAQNHYYACRMDPGLEIAFHEHYYNPTILCEGPFAWLNALDAMEHVIHTIEEGEQGLIFINLGHDPMTLQLLKALEELGNEYPVIACFIRSGQQPSVSYPLELLCLEPSRLEESMELTRQMGIIEKSLPHPAPALPRPEMPWSSRDHLDSELMELIQSGKRMILIEGSCGCGKSMFMEHLSQTLPGVHTLASCSFARSEGSGLMEMGSSIILSLARQIKEYRMLLLDRIEKLPDSADLSPKDFFFRYFVQPLRQISHPKDDLVYILIDGLDEFDDGSWGSHPLASLLASMSPDLPDWICLITASRPDVRVLASLKGVSTVFSMDASLEENIQDIRQFLHSGKVLGQCPLDVWSLEQLAVKSEGNFLFASLLSKMDADDPDHLPASLESLYYELFQSLFVTEEQYEQYRPLLSALCVSPEPIPWTTMKRMTGWSAIQARKKIDHIQKILQMDSSLVLFHKSVCEWLMSDEAHEFMMDEADGFKAMAKACFLSWKEGLHNMNDYEIRWLVPMIERCGGIDQKACIFNDPALAALLYDKAKEKLESRQYDPACALACHSADIYRAMDSAYYKDKEILSCQMAASLCHRLIQTDKVDIYASRLLTLCDPPQNKEQYDACGYAASWIAYNHFRNSRHDQAEACYDLAIESFQKAGNNHMVLEMLRKKAEMHALDNENRKALECMDLAWSLCDAEELEQTNPALACALYRTHAHMHLKNKDLEPAIAMISNALDIYHTCPGQLTSNDKGRIFQIYAQILNFAHEEQKVIIENARMAVKYLEEEYGSQSVEICDALEFLGQMLGRNGEFEEAEMCLKKGCVLKTAAYTKHSYITSLSMADLASLYIQMDTEQSRRKAMDLLEQVIEIRQDLCKGRQRIGLARVCVDYAMLLIRCHDEDKLERPLQIAWSVFCQYKSELKDSFTSEKLLALIPKEE